jgi:hypothetical protein
VLTFKRLDSVLLSVSLADCPRIPCGLSATRQPANCSLCSLHVLGSLRFDALSQVFLVGASLADRPPGGHGSSAGMV